LDSHWFGSLDPETDWDPHREKRWSRVWIRTETNADPQHYKKVKVLFTRYRTVLIRLQEMQFNDIKFFNG
jgi:hypothetical protein